MYPVVAQLMGGEDPMGTMERAHMEIEHLARVFGHLLSDLPPEGPSPDDLVDLRRVLYGLHAILRLHFAQEEEAYSWLAAEADRPERVAARPGWDAIPAVRDGELHEVKSPIILQPGPAALSDGLDALHRIIIAWVEKQKD